jgi:hypothetical protein
MTRGPSVGANRRVSSVAKVRKSWGESAPDWMLQLAESCDETSQRHVAGQLGVSAALISNALANKYGADLRSFETKVRAILIDSETRDCPVLHEISAAECFRHQRARFSTASPQAVRLFTACKSCPYARKKNDQ